MNMILKELRNRRWQRGHGDRRHASTSDSASDQVIEKFSAPSSPQHDFTQQHKATDEVLRPFPVHDADLSEMQLSAFPKGARSVQRSGYNVND